MAGLAVALGVAPAVLALESPEMLLTLIAALNERNRED